METNMMLKECHHIDPNTKEFCIGANSTSKSEEVLVNEIKKCVCLCSNCHDEFHYLYGSKPKEPVKALQEYLKESEEKQHEINRFN